MSFGYKTYIVGLIILAAAGFAGYYIFSSGFTPGSEPGHLAGKVSFVGTPCAKGGKTPPCDGPYANYEIEVFREDGKTLETRTVSNSDGGYFVLLPRGRYVIYTSTGLSQDREEHKVQILPDKATSLDLVIELPPSSSQI